MGASWLFVRQIGARLLRRYAVLAVVGVMIFTHVGPTFAQVGAEGSLDGGYRDYSTALANAATSGSTGTCSVPTSTTTDSQTFSAIASALVNPFSSADTTISSAALGIANGMTAGALSLGGILAVSYLLWSTLRFIAAGDDNFMSLAIECLVPAAVGAGLVTEYSQIVSGLQGLFSTMLTSVAGSGGLTSSLIKFANSIFNAFGTAMLSAAQGASCTSFLTTGAVGEFLHSLIIILLMLLGSLLAVVAFADLVGVMLTGSVLVGVGISVGPYFVMCGITKWSKGFLERWIGFTTTAMFYKTAIAIVLALMTGVMKAVAQEAADYSGGKGGFPIGDAVAMVGLMWVMKHVFLAIPSMATGLFGGAGIGAPSLNRAATAAMKEIRQHLEGRERDNERRENSERAQRNEQRAERAEDRAEREHAWKGQLFEAYMSSQSGEGHRSSSSPPNAGRPVFDTGAGSAAPGRQG